MIVPTGVNVLASGAYLYVTAYDSSVTANAGYVFGFSIGYQAARLSAAQWRLSPYVAVRLSIPRPSPAIPPAATST